MKKIALALLGLAGLFTMTMAQDELKYQKPPKEILELADFQRPPALMIDNHQKHMVFRYRDTYQSLAELSAPELRLAGLRINPITRISSTLRYYNKLSYKGFSSQELKTFEGLPDSPKIAYTIWSPDQSKFAFTHTTETGVELWLADLETGQAKKLTEDRLNATLGRPFTWDNEGKGLYIFVRPSDNPALVSPKEAIPEGPIASNTLVGQVAQNITYQDLLKSPIDEQNFETLVRSEIHYVDLNGNSQLWAEADLFSDLTISPDGNYLLTSSYTRPYSYILPSFSFPVKTEVRSTKGELIKEINHKPLVENKPRGFMSTYTGKRYIAWRADKPATLYWVEAQDEGDANKPVEFRDFVYQWDAPFEQEPQYLSKTINRFAGITWGNANTAVLYDSWWDTRNQKIYTFNPAQPNEDPKILFDLDYQDAYQNPGSFDTEKNDFGRYVLRLNGQQAYLIGDGFRPDGQFPFVDEINLKTQAKKRIFESAYTDKKLSISRIIDPKAGEFLVNLQSSSDYPNYYLLHTKKRIAPIQLTFFENPFKAMEGVYKELITYTRKDGVQLSGTLYLPANYDRVAKTEKLPLVMWAYPAEYKDKNSAGQTTTNPNEFIFPYYGSPIYWVTQGYAILDNAAFPIVGEGEEEPNDTFVEQLIANAEAAIDELDARGYIDRARVAIGGHSYGAFMTANLLSHCDLFAAGIARSGAYNRTLTPFGFQNEQRTYWDAPEVYNTMSPFMHADKMKTPLLLIHGADDNNAGTHTMQSERYFSALKGFGAPARLVLLPKESHSYFAKESVLHVLWEQDQWLDKYVKNKKK